ncbi:MAG: hypothetical protein NT077_03980, partial [Candidatus Taylorbacteria bacterium]|nr:hypothetical protein [Candidatus Taylorbacteria bacterium]
IGAQHIERMEKLGFSKSTEASGRGRDKENYGEAKEKITAALKDYFRPEFLNRVDDIIIFDILSPEAIKQIVRIQVAEVVKRLSDKNIELVMSDAVLEHLAKEGYNPQYGARPLRRLIQSKILTPVANLLISQSVVKGGAIMVGLKPAMGTVGAGKTPDGGAVQEFTFEVRKKHKGESPIIVRDSMVQK